MKALDLTHPGLTQENLLRKAEETPGAWMGIRIAGLLLMLSGWKSSQVAELFGLTRWAVVKWMHKANREGVESVQDHPRSGRPSRFDESLLQELDEVLSKSPQEVGFPRSRWDGVVLVEYLKKTYRIQIHVRHAQRLMRKLGYTLRRPVYRFVQATDEGVREFQEQVKKTPPGAGTSGKTGGPL